MDIHLQMQKHFQLKKLKKLSNMKLIDILTERGYRTDKHTDHRYVQEFYEKEFADLQEKKLNVLEIGILYGESLKLWHDYFINSNIYGADNFHRVSEADVSKNLSKFNRIKQSLNVNTLKEKLQFDVQMDIIIDDGCHGPGAQVITYNNSKHLLKEGGIYIIEDIARPHETSKEIIEEGIPEIKWIPIDYKGELIGVIKNG